MKGDAFHFPSAEPLMAHPGLAVLLLTCGSLRLSITRDNEGRVLQSQTTFPVQTPGRPGEPPSAAFPARGLRDAGRNPGFLQAQPRRGNDRPPWCELRSESRFYRFACTFPPALRVQERSEDEDYTPNLRLVPVSPASVSALGTR